MRIVASIRRLEPAAVDGVAAAVLAAAAQIELWASGSIGGPAPLPSAAAIAGTLPVVWRRRHPLATLAVVTAVNTALDATVGPASSLAMAVAVVYAMYGASVWTDNRGFAGAVGCVWARDVGAGITITGSGGALGAFGWFVVPPVVMLIVRITVRGRELRAEALAARAELLERERELLAREAAASERATIARELHDVVAHKVSVMVVQAGAERSVLDPRAVSTVETLRAIEVSGREALVELRRLLGVLRGGSERDAMHPQPTLVDVGPLIDQVRDAGLDVALSVEGTAASLPGGVELSAYRIVQEALTNVLKHASGAHADVRLRYGPEALEIEVRDAGGGQTAIASAGHGLLGMRERAAMHGGSVEAGPEPDGGFCVRARLPVTA